MKYLYNKSTRKYHIEGYCYFADSRTYGYEIYLSESELPNGAAICKKCSDKREHILNENKYKQHNK